MSSDPDIRVTAGNLAKDDFIILATDGLWDVFTSQTAVDFVLKGIGTGNRSWTDQR